jgi:hypothetical protein
MTAKDFLIIHDDRFEYAVKMNAKISLSVDEVALLLERYKTSLPKTIQVCPKCDGEGTVPNNGMMSTALFRDCPVCKGIRYFTI